MLFRQKGVIIYISTSNNKTISRVVAVLESRSQVGPL